MAKKELTIADVDQAEAELVAAKKNKKLSTEELNAIMQQVAETRSAFRQQEVDAGRRAPGISVTTEGNE